MRTLVAAEVRRGRRRVIAPSIAIAIAVAFVTVTFGATNALRSYLFQAIAARAGAADVIVADLSASASHPPTPDLAARVSAVPGVATAEAVYGGTLEVSWPDGGDVTAVGSVQTDPALRWMRATVGRLPGADGEVAVDAGTASDLGLHPGDRLTLFTTDQRRVAVTLVGVADLGASPTLGGLRGLVAGPADVAAWTGDQVLEIDVRITDGQSPSTVRDRIRAALGTGSGDGLTARTGDEHAAVVARAFSGGVDVLSGITLAFAAVAVVTAMIVIANTFGAIFAQRARSLALLRCLGATRRQVFGSVLAETALIGAVASLLGVLAGVGVTALGVAVLGARYASMAGVRAEVTPTMLVVPFVVGMLVALSAALAPARRATRVAPLAALRPVDVGAARRASRVRVVAGAVLMAVGVTALALGAGPLAGAAGLLLGVLGGTLTLVGVLLEGPVLVPAAVRAVGLVLRRWVPGRLAVGNAVRNPSRAASTSVALFVGVSLVTMMSVGAASVTAGADRATARQYPIDLAVLTPPGVVLPDRVLRGLTALSGTADVAPLTGATVRDADGGDLDLVAADPVAFARVWRDARVRLGDEVALLPPSTADRLDLRDGSPLRLSAAGGSPVTLRVLVAEVPRTTISTGALAELTGGGAPPRGVVLRARPDVDASTFRTQVRREVRAVDGVRTSGAVTQSAQIHDAVTVALRVVVALLAVAVVIALVGITNTLVLSVLERTRELAVQRALGMTRRQLRLGLTTEAVLLAVVGAGLGVVLGAGYGWAGASALLGELTDVPLVVPWASVVATALVSALAGAAASVLPGRRAARLSPMAALSAE